MAGRRAGQVVWAVVALCLGATGACSSDSGSGKPKAAPTKATTTTAAPLAWKSQGLTAVSPPVGDGNTVAVVDGASPDLSVVVLDATTGKERFRRAWSPSRQFGGMGVGSPAVLGDVVVTMEASSADTAIVGVDAHSGAERWRQVVPESFAPFACGTFVCTEQGPDATAALIARDPATGATKWTSPGSQSADFAPGMLIEQHLGPPVLYSIDPATGATKWKTDLRPSVGSKATTDNGWDGYPVGGMFVAGVEAGTVGVDPATGAVKWKRLGLVPCSVHLRTLALLCDAKFVVHRVDPATGADKWATPPINVPADSGPIFGVAADESALFASDAAKKPIRIDAGTGAVSPVTGDILAWTLVFGSTHARVRPTASLDEYQGIVDLVPLNASGGTPPAVTEASQIPATVGITVSGRRIFVDGSGTVRAVGA